MSLYRDYRPSTWDSLIGHTQVVASINRMRDRGTLGGNAFWLTGDSGVGKMTIAYLIAADVCDPDNFVELDAGEITPAAITELENNLRYRCIGSKSGRAVLLNEVHGLRKDTIRKLLVVLERIPKHVTWICTTTCDGQQKLFDGIDAHPLLSRCFEFKLRTPYGQFAERVKEIAESEGLGGAQLVEYVELAKRCKGNMRQMLCLVETGDMLREETAFA